MLPHHFATQFFSVILLASLMLNTSSALAQEGKVVEVPADVLEDKIRGGMLGQILGNLNGLPHEMKYIAEPGNVKAYTPSLPEGARTDDDTDIEWVYVVEMQKTGQLYLPPATQVGLWKKHINGHIWCSNLYARRLFDLGLEPPLTGALALNPWANFNISGSFLAETFGLCAPGMPQTAGKLGLHYTRVAIDAEPAQSTQFTNAMIATAFFENDLDKILDAGVAGVHGESVIREVVDRTRAWVKEHPDDWKATRTAARDAWTRVDGGMFDRNGVRLNTAATVAALLYGKGDFAQTLRHAFNFGWDADNNAATGGTIIGVIKGKKWMDQQRWDVKDVYRNTTRPGMPQDETITRYTDRVIDLARKAIEENGGTVVKDGGKVTGYRIRVQQPANVEPLPDPPSRVGELREKLVGPIETGLAGSPAERARAAYLAICIGEAPRLRKERPADWAAAIRELQKQPIVKEIFAAPDPDGPDLREKATAAGLKRG